MAAKTWVVSLVARSSSMQMTSTVVVPNEIRFHEPLLQHKAERPDRDRCVVTDDDLDRTSVLNAPRDPP